MHDHLNEHRATPVDDLWHNRDGSGVPLAGAAPSGHFRDRVSAGITE
jgi:hypothetical protein